MSVSTAGLPEFDIHRFQARSSSYLVIIPVKNEKGRIEQQLEKMRRLTDQFDLLIVDGGSSDGSFDLEFYRSAGLTAVIRMKGAGGLGSQIRLGLNEVLNSGYLGAILIDGNNKDDPSLIPEFAKRLSEGFDFVQGSRFIPGGSHRNTPWIRWAGIRLIHAPLISWAAKFHYSDTTNGFRGVSKRLISSARLAMLRPCFTGYELHYFIAIQAPKQGFKVCELPVRREYPSSGPTPTKIRGVRGNFLVFKKLLATVFGKYDLN